RAQTPSAVAAPPESRGGGQKGHTAEQGDVCTDYLAHRNAKDIQRKTSMQVVGAGTFFQHLPIHPAGRKSKKAAPMVEQNFKFIGAELLIAHEIEKDARIEIAGARAHRNAARGSEAHGGVDRYSVSKSA